LKIILKLLFGHLSKADNTMLNRVGAIGDLLAVPGLGTGGLLAMEVP